MTIKALLILILNFLIFTYVTYFVKNFIKKIYTYQIIMSWSKATSYGLLCSNSFDFSSLSMLLLALALSTCTTLVSVEPKVMVEA